MLLVAGVFVAMTSRVYAQAPATVTPESLVKAAKRAAGVEYAGTFLRICVAPDNLEGGAGRGAAPPGPRNVPDRALWYAKPYKVFDNLYFVGTKIHSSWALTTTDGIVLLDTLFDYAVERDRRQPEDGRLDRAASVRADQPAAITIRAPPLEPLRREGRVDGPLVIQRSSVPRRRPAASKTRHRRRTEG